MIRVPSRVKRHTNKFTEGSGLNLISMMDILTTLVFFLLIHVTSDIETIPVPGIVRLPASFSTTKPTPSRTIYITTNEILIEDKKIVDVRSILNSRESSIERLEKALLSDIADNKNAALNDKKPEKKIIIMGDKDIPFTLFKKVMNTCSRAGYSTITLAVLQKDAL